MENQAAKAEEGIDRISELPQPILHRILCFLSQRQSIQTSVLSKSWRHVGSTRPNITLNTCRDFKGTKSNDQELVVSVLDKTLQSYRDRKLSIDKFDVGILSADLNSIPALRKWIPILMLDMRVKVFSLVFHQSYFDLPSVVFEAESLRALYLKRCRVNDCYPLIDKNKILCKHLHTLHLREVHISKETIEMLLSNCPSIENVSILHCLFDFGFKTLRLVDEPPALKHIEVRGDDKNTSFEIEHPTISTISITGCCLPQHYMYLPRLVRLSLTDVRLSSEPFDSFSCDFPCLHTMELFNCSGFKEFNLSSGSIKKLSISNLKGGTLCRASIYAPSIASFHYRGPLLKSFSWSTTTSSEWRSDIDLGGFYADSRKSASEWFDKLNGFLAELRQSEIYLTVDGPGREIRKNTININGVLNDIIYMRSNPVEVECLNLSSWGCFDTYFPVFLDCIFCKCRPRYIGECTFINSDDCYAKGVNRHFWNVHEIFFKELGKAKDRRRSLWQRGLEEASMESFDKNMKEWRCVQSTRGVKGRVVKFRFRLKWRELRSQVGINR